MISWIIDLLKRLTGSERRRRDRIIQSYRTIGRQIGFALSQRRHDTTVRVAREGSFDVNDPELYHLLRERELAYALLGYRIIPLQSWVDYGGWKVPIADLWLISREDNESPVFTKFYDVLLLLVN